MKAITPIKEYLVSECIYASFLLVLLKGDPKLITEKKHVSSAYFPRQFDNFIVNVAPCIVVMTPVMTKLINGRFFV